jgi:dipeptidyl aminopeptidase/acylaminoacyl peptidase
MFVRVARRFLSLIAFAAPLAAQGRPLALEDYYRIKTVSAPAISADGRTVTFTVSSRIEENNGNAAERWTVPIDGSSPAHRITDTTASQAGAPAGGRGGGRGNAAARPMRSPDGKWTATLRDFAPPARPAPAATEFEKRHEARFKGAQFDYMDFHRDGQPFPLPNRRDPQLNPPQEIVVTGADGAEHQLTRLGLRPTGVEWAKDGSMLLFTADSLYRNERSYGRTEIWTVSVDGKLSRLTPNKDFDYAGATFSPDGKWILATRGFATDMIIAKKLNHGGPNDLVVIPAGGGKEINLTAAWDYLPVNPRFSPDGQSIYFTGVVGGTIQLFRVSPAGGPVEQITHGQRTHGDIVFDRAFTKMVYLVGLNDRPSELYSANIDGTNETQLTHINDDFTREVALSKSERLLFKSGDGTPIEGWLTFPYGYRPDGGPYPLVVNSHGGPHAATMYGFSFRNHYLASAGYFVLETNFRSSVGYGEKFLWATWGAWGTKDGQDVMAGIDYAISKYPIDRARVAATGHSYGGFMTNWLITQYPNRFAAAISGAGIANWMSDYGNADIPVTKEQEFFGAPWDPTARAIMLKQSPLIYANKAKAPTLFVVGEVDQRVPFSEAEQMYVALKKNGVPAKMMRYDDMPHSISGHWNMVYRMLNDRRWFDQWMKQKTVP